MRIKEKLKKIDLIYDINAYLKSLQLKNDSKKIESWYGNEYKKSGLVYNEEIAEKLFKQRVNKRRIQMKNEKPTILWIGACKEQDYSGFIQGLRKFGNILEYIDDDGKYLLKLQENSFNPNIIIENDNHLLNFIEKLNESGQKIDILIGQLWANVVSVEFLKKIQSKRIITVNVSMDDRLPNLWKPYKGLMLGAVGLADGLDLILTTSPECCIRYLYHGCPAIYWPLGSDPEIFKPALEKDIDVSFIGNCYGIRKDIVNKLARRGISVTTYGRGWKNGPIEPNRAGEIFGRSKIILGIGTVAYNYDIFTLKLRDFDATMSGSLYLTHRNPDLVRIFKEGHEAEYYLSVEEAAQKIIYYLNNQGELQKVSENAAKKAREEFTWEKRFKTVFDFIGVNN